MIEWLALPLAVAGAALIPRNLSDKKKIDIVFKNRKICIGKDDPKYPKFKRKEPGDGYVSYHYSLPLGIPSEALEVVLPALKEALNKEVEYDFENGLIIDVFDGELPEKWVYDETLIREGKWEVPIGKNHKGILYHDFDKYPHMLVGGVTRFGKTVLLKNIFHTLLMNQWDNAEFYFIDLKGGMEFGRYAGLPQVKAVASDVYEAAETLAEIVDKFKNLQTVYRQKGITNVVESDNQKRIFVIVDEGAELSPDIVTAEKKKYAQFCQAALSEIARIGGALGFRLIYSTQYPTKQAVPMQVKMNIVARISFIAASQVSSRVILDDVGAEDLPSIPGRAIYLVEKKRTVQVPYISDKMMFSMLEGRANESTGNIVDDHRPIGSGENTAVAKNS